MMTELTPKEEKIQNEAKAKVEAFKKDIKERCNTHTRIYMKAYAPKENNTCNIEIDFVFDNAISIDIHSIYEVKENYDITINSLKVYTFGDNNKISININVETEGSSSF